MVRQSSRACPVYFCFKKAGEKAMIRLVGLHCVATHCILLHVSPGFAAQACFFFLIPNTSCFFDQIPTSCLLCAMWWCEKNLVWTAYTKEGESIFRLMYKQTYIFSLVSKSHAIGNLKLCLLRPLSHLYSLFCLAASNASPRRESTQKCKKHPNPQVSRLTHHHRRCLEAPSSA